MRALIIANGDFADSRITPLKSPVTDAQRLQALLARDDVGPYDVELCANLDSYHLRQAVEHFFNAAEFEDRQLLFFSGHGFKHGSDGRLYFGTKDTTREKMRSSSLSSRFVFEEASASVAQQTIIFIDSCYSGAFVRGHTLKATDQVVARDDFDVDGAHGMAIITASSSVQTAAENEVNDFTQSVFTRHLIDGIETGRADPEHTGQINLHGLFRYVRTQMRRDAPDQEPKPHYFGLDGSVEVARNPVRLVTTAPEVVLPKRLINRVGGSIFSTRRTACGELYHFADGNPAAVDVVRGLLEQLTLDPHDFVKDEAYFQLKRLEQRFPTEEAEVRAQEATESDAASVPTPDPPPTAPDTGFIDDATPDSGGATESEPPESQPLGDAVAADSGFADKMSPKWWSLICGITLAIIIGIWVMVDRAADAETQAEIAKAADAAADTAVAPAATPDQPEPGEWLIGEWAINPSVNGCTEYRHIVRGDRDNQLVFRTLGNANDPADTDVITFADSAELTTDTTRYRLNPDGTITAAPLTGGGSATTLKKWWEAGCAM